MALITVNRQEIFNVLQEIPLVKMNLSGEEAWELVQVLYIDLSGIHLMAEVDWSKRNVVPGKAVSIKFQKSGYEYIIQGSVLAVDDHSSSYLCIGHQKAQKYFDLRKHMRFDTKLKGWIGNEEGSKTPVSVYNISMGGALINLDDEIQLGTSMEIQIVFNSGNRFFASARMIRKLQEENGTYSYGLEFVQMSENNCNILSEEISKLQKEYLEFVDFIRRQKNSKSSITDKKFLVVSADPDGSQNICKMLRQVGINDFDVFRHFTFYSEYFTQEKPDIILDETETMSDKIIQLANDIKNYYSDTHLLVIVPMGVAESGQLQLLPGEIDILFKPLIYKEFESILIKYL